MIKFIAYYRVSTTMQEKSGLGLEAQRMSVRAYCAGAGAVVAEYQDVISGGKNNRSGLSEAIAHAKRDNCKLVVAKLDRLSRDAEFICNLLNREITLVFLDLGLDTSTPMGRMGAQMLGVFAEFERMQIKSRCKDAYAAALRDPLRAPKLIGERNRQKHQGYLTAHGKAIKEVLDEGYSLRATGRSLKAKGIPTPGGSTCWHPEQVSRVAQDLA